LASADGFDMKKLFSRWSVCASKILSFRPKAARCIGVAVVLFVEYWNYIRPLYHIMGKTWKDIFIYFSSMNCRMIFWGLEKAAEL